MARLLPIVIALALPGLSFAASQTAASAAPSARSQLRDAHAQLHDQRTRSRQLKEREEALERQEAMNRMRLEQRDREIADLQHRLDPLQGSDRNDAPVPPSSAGH